MSGGLLQRNREPGSVMVEFVEKARLTWHGKLSECILCPMAQVGPSSVSKDAGVADPATWLKINIWICRPWKTAAV